MNVVKTRANLYFSSALVFQQRMGTRSHLKMHRCCSSSSTNVYVTLEEHLPVAVKGQMGGPFQYRICSFDHLGYLLHPPNLCSDRVIASQLSSQEQGKPLANSSWVLFLS